MDAEMIVRAQELTKQIEDLNKVIDWLEGEEAYMLELKGGKRLKVKDDNKYLFTSLLIALRRQHTQKRDLLELELRLL